MALIVNKRVGKVVMGYNLKNDRRISVQIQDRSFNITIIQVYAPTTDAEEAEIDQSYQGFQHLLELTPKKDVLIIGHWFLTLCYSGVLDCNFQKPSPPTVLTGVSGSCSSKTSK